MKVKLFPWGLTGLSQSLTTFESTGCKYLDPEGINDVFISLTCWGIYCSNMNAINAFETWICQALFPLSSMHYNSAFTIASNKKIILTAKWTTPLL